MVSPETESFVMMLMNVWVLIITVMPLQLVTTTTVSIHANVIKVTLVMAYSAMMLTNA